MSDKDIEQRVIEAVAKSLDKKPEDVQMTSSFTADLGADSLATVELVMKLEDEFDCTIPEEVNMTLQTVQDAVDFIKKVLAEKS